MTWVTIWFALLCLVRADQRPTACSSQNECDCDDVCRPVPSRRKDRRHGRREVCKQPEQRGGKLWLDNSRQGGDIVVCSTKLNRVKMVGQGSQTSSWLHSNLNKTGGLEKYKTWGLPPPRGEKQTEFFFYHSFVYTHTKKQSTLGSEESTGYFTFPSAVPGGTCLRSTMDRGPRSKETE